MFLDQFVHHPFLYFPVFYATREFVMAEKPDLVRCLSTYKENMKEDLTALWKVWVPSTVVNFVRASISTIVFVLRLIFLTTLILTNRHLCLCGLVFLGVLLHL